MHDREMLTFLHMYLSICSIIGYFNMVKGIKFSLQIPIKTEMQCKVIRELSLQKEHYHKNVKMIGASVELPTF